MNLLRSVKCRNGQGVSSATRQEMIFALLAYPESQATPSNAVRWRSRYNDVQARMR